MEGIKLSKDILSILKKAQFNTPLTMANAKLTDNEREKLEELELKNALLTEELKIWKTTAQDLSKQLAQFLERESNRTFDPKIIRVTDSNLIIALQDKVDQIEKQITRLN